MSLPQHQKNSPQTQSKPAADNAVLPTNAAMSSRKATYDAKREIKMKLLTGEYILKERVFKDGANHEVWKAYRLVLDAKEKKRLDWVMCIQCEGVQVYKEDHGVSALLRHILTCPNSARLSFKASDNMHVPPPWTIGEFRKAQAAFCALDLQTPEAFNGAGMQQLLETALSIGSKCGKVSLPRLKSSPIMVAARIREEAEKVRASITPEVRVAMMERRVAATMDGFTNAQTKGHFLAFTVHYISAEWKAVSRTLFTLSFPPDEPATALNINAALHHNLEAMGLSTDLLEGTVFVTDGGQDMADALEPYRRSNCIGHAYNAVVCTALSVNYACIVKAVRNHCREADDIIGRCNQWVQEAQKALPDGSPILKKLTCSLPNSENHLPPLLSYSLNSQQVEDVLGQQSPAIGVDETSLREVIEFLRPLDLASSTDMSPTVSPKLNGTLQEAFQPEMSDSPLVSDMKRAGMEVLVIMDAVMVISECKELMGYLDRSGLRDHLPEVTMQTRESRWNTPRETLVFLNNHWKEIEKFLEDQENCKESSAMCRSAVNRHKERLETIDRRLVSDLIDFLTPFEAHSRKLQGKNYSTLPYVVLAQTQLIDHCTWKKYDGFVMEAVRRKALHLLTSQVHIMIEHKIAVFLWPRYKDLAPFPMHADKEEIYVAVRERMNSDQPAEREEEDAMSRLSAQSSSTGSPSPSDHSASEVDYAFSSRKRMRLCLSDEELYGSLMLRAESDVDEVEKYKRMSQSDIGDDSDLLKWWAVQGSVRFPKLAKVARQVLAIPATAAHSDVNFIELSGLICSTSVSPNDTLVWRDHLKLEAIGS